MTLEAIKESISDEFIEFRKIFDSAFTAEEQLLKQVLEHVCQQKGKQVRPVFTILCGRLCGNINRSSHNVAVAYELLHTASLIHDDVVDNTMQRRGQLSVNAKFDNRTSVLVGDYLLSKAMNFIVDTGSVELYKQLSYLGMTLSRGELLQLQHAYTIPTESEYIDIVRKKTAVLFSVSALSAAISVGASDFECNAVREFAENLGICFQIKDDIFDYSPNAQIGKPTLNDIRDGKITLPLLHVLEKVSPNDAASVLDAIKNGVFTEDFFYNIGILVARNGGIEYAEERIAYYRSKALDALDTFPDFPTKSSLIALFDYVITRKK